MTVREERVLEVTAPPEAVWEAIADPELRANAISVVSGYELDAPDGSEATWHLDLPIPLVGRLVPVHTRDRVREPPNRVEFVGQSRVMRIRGEHVLEPSDGGTRVTNRFVVDGKLPGVERFFRRNLDREMDNIERAIRARFEEPVEDGTDEAGGGSVTGDDGDTGGTGGEADG